MFRARAIIFSLIALLVLSSYTPNQKQYRNQMSEGEITYEEFVTKPYFDKIFNRSEQRALSRLERKVAKAEKNKAKAHDYYREANKNKRIARATKNAKTMNKAINKAVKSDAKGIKAHLKALSDFQVVYSGRYEMYKLKLSKIKPLADEAGVEYSRKLTRDAIDLNAEAKKQYDAAAQKEGRDKVDLLIKAQEIEVQVLNKLQTALGVYFKDPAINVPGSDSLTDDFADYNEDIINIDEFDEGADDENQNNISDNEDTFVQDDKELNRVEKTVKANIKTVNGNMYFSHQDEIYKAIDLNAQDVAKVGQAAKLTEEANNDMQKVESMYVEIDKYNDLADKTNDQTQKSAYREKVIKLEGDLFIKLIAATKKYIESNSLRYDIYNKYIEHHRSNYPAVESKGKILENEAQTLFRISKTKMRLADNLQFRHQQYIKLMEANELQLIGLEKIEEAFLMYLNLQVDDVESITHSTDSDMEDIITPIEKPEKGASDAVKNHPRTYATTSLPLSKVQVAALTDDFLYRVQVGVFKELSPTLFDNKYRITSKKLKNSGYNVFFAGDFKSREAIEIVLDRVRAKGFDDAFIVCYIGGKLVSPAQADKTISGNAKLKEKYKEIAKYETKKLTAGSAYSDINKNQTANNDNTGKNDGNKQENTGETDYAIDVSSTSYLAYFVQLGSYSNVVDQKVFKGLSPLYYQKTADGKYRFMKGIYRDFASANAALTTIKKQSFPEAYMVAFNNGEHVKLYKAKELEKKVNGGVLVEKPAKVSYKVQVIAIKDGTLAPDMKKILDRIGQYEKVEKIKRADGYTVYTVGNYASYKDAEVGQNKLKAYNLYSTFIVAYEGNKNISLDEAKKKLNK